MKSDTREEKILGDNEDVRKRKPESRAGSGIGVGHNETWMKENILKEVQENQASPAPYMLW